jgi:hypothetical protein
LLCFNGCVQQSARHNMWTETTRPQGLRYSSDVTDAEWLVISPHLPQRKRFGRPSFVFAPPVWFRLCQLRGQVACPGYGITNRMPRHAPCPTYWHSVRRSDAAWLQRYRTHLGCQGRDNGPSQNSPVLLAGTFWNTT